MADDERDEKAFVSHCGLIRWLRMPFGLKNAPGTFQRAADVILDGVEWHFALVYLEFIIIYSILIEDHYDHLTTVLDLVHKAGISLKTHMCEFLKESIDYLGHRISPAKLKLNEMTMEAVQKALPPRNVPAARSFQ